MYKSKDGTNKPNRVSISQLYVLYSCNYDNEIILTLTCLMFFSGNVAAGVGDLKQYIANNRK